MDFFIILTTPENMKTVCATLQSQCSIVKFAKIAQNWLDFSFLAIILVLDKENPNFFDFLDPYTCPDLGQEESQKVWSTLVITLVETLVPTVLSFLKSKKGSKKAREVWDSNPRPQSYQNLLHKNVIFRVKYLLSTQQHVVKAYMQRQPKVSFIK